jgi:hypothetical protein
MSFRGADDGDSRLLTTVWMFALVALAGAVRILWWYWPGSIFDGVTSHIWTALAWNFAHGEFYRPPLGPNGYGGTRYMPLLFVAHGLLIRAHADAIGAGVMLMQGSVIAAAAALFLALRSLNVSARLALALALTVFGTVIYQQYCTDLDPDYLAAAFGVAAIAFTLSSDGSRGAMRLAAAYVAVVLAALTKVTALAYILPIAAWLAARGRIRAAAGVTLATAVLFGAAIVLIQVASHGQFGEGFRATVSGGMGTSDVWRAAPKFVREMALDPFVAAPFVVACWCVAAAARCGRLTLADATLATTAIVTLIIFASPGTVGNHLVDLHMASVMVIGVALARGTLSPRPAAGLFAALAVVLAAISMPVPGIPSVIATLRAQGLPSRAVVRAIHDEFLPPGTHYLSTDPVIELLNDERPLVLDAFNLNRFFKEGTPAGGDVERRIRRHEYQAIVVQGDRSDAGERNDLERLIYANYDIRVLRPPFVILVPRD